MKYTVRFEQYHTYEVDAVDECDAVDKAHEEFLRDMRTSVADTWYDAIEISCDEE